jgi:hypothetical protein
LNTAADGTSVFARNDFTSPHLRGGRLPEAPNAFVTAIGATSVTLVRRDLSRLNELTKLAPGWAGRGAGATFNPSSIAAAEGIIATAVPLIGQANEIVPIAPNTIFLSWSRENRSFEVEVPNEGPTRYMACLDDDISREGVVDESSMSALLHWLTHRMETLP